MIPATYGPIVALLVLRTLIRVLVRRKYSSPSAQESPEEVNGMPMNFKISKMIFPFLEYDPDVPKSWNALWISTPLLLVGIATLLTWTYSKRFTLAPRGGAVSESQAALRSNLERLVPPPALPPSTFISAERPELETADREWSHLDPDFMEIVLKLRANMARRGYHLALLEGYRSPERQDMLAGKGPLVTNAKAYQSKHQFRMAADLAPIKNGVLVISETDPWASAAYRALGEEAAALGLIWGGNWSTHDLGHVESSRSIESCHQEVSPQEASPPEPEQTQEAGPSDHVPSSEYLSTFTRDQTN